MDVITKRKSKVLAGAKLSRAEVLDLLDTPLEALTAAAEEIRAHFCGSAFDLCTIVNGKCGRCSEDCKYCAQSSHYPAACEESYPLLSAEELVRQARRSRDQGVLRYSIVTSGKRLSHQEVEEVCGSIRAIRTQVGIPICVSFGLQTEEQFRKLKAAGASRVHCNLETSLRYFPQICTTHTYEEKIQTLKAARRAGLELCSGGILGLGESMEDRMDLALTLRSLGVKSIPMNLLHPIPGTPFAHNPVPTNEALCRTIALFRFLLPDGFLRLAGGRDQLEDQGERCLCSGANAVISGDMLTTTGSTVQRDWALAEKLGFTGRPKHG